jgi:uncharacterized protein (DUF58 family)
MIQGTRLSPSNWQRLHAAARSRLGLLLGFCAISISLAIVQSHASIAAVAVGSVIAIGALAPLVMVWCASVSIASDTTRCFAGDRVTLTLAAKSRLPVPLPELQLDVPHLLRPPSEALTLRPGTSTHVVATAATRRGVVDLSICGLLSGFPFGLVRARRRATGGNRLVIWPRPTPVDASVLSARSDPLAVDWTHARSSAGGELVGVRGYRRGDSMRSIHWQQTSKHGRLIVTERAGGTSRQLGVWLDTRSTSFADPEQFEEAVSQAAGFVDLAERSGVAVVINIARQRFTVNDDRSRRDALDALALVVLDGDSGPVPSQSASVVCITTSHGWRSCSHDRNTPMLVADRKAVPA